MNRRTLLPLVWLLAIAVVVVGAISVLQRVRTSAKEQLTIIGGETRKDWETPGFGISGGEITSPGPPIRVKRGHRLTITFRNVHGTHSRERIAHNFVLVAEIKVFPERAEPLWGVKTDDIRAGESTTVTFTPETAGEFFYVCDIPGHPERGMYGSFLVEE